ncbi:hypothetical protein G7Z17_g1052 [Cylindrodendrum hubeiense]|uniref:Carboxylesterase type B domain-containing protein n=1 Tax=Cylindrodendrum hubeiense TaxID=595255 RepID=A0A9P5HJ96_9HYPO|nr:hypothetical protein G7Z17_g1052 [Cylindrodendrum hubeiense]
MTSAKRLNLNKQYSQPAQADLPQLKLPWGTWQATPYAKDPKIYVFKDVRFGDEPVRFGAPVTPTSLSDELQNITRSTSCIQINPQDMKYSPGGKNLLGDPEGADVSESEDCLFLDIYVPVSAFDPGAEPLPVIVWLYGGAYAFGSKNQADPLYTGQSLLEASNYNTIFIAGNYRVGAFGWLAGSYMQEAGQPNAGLYDQALLLQWVQDYVGNVNGDKEKVSAWGESAGAGSILHHLIRGDGSDPLFRTFVAQSPAYQWAWDNSRDGKLDQTYKKFSEDAGCGSAYDISCLRDADLENLKAANRALYNNVKHSGLFPVGPSVDGDWVKTIPTIALSEVDLSGKIDSAIISHCGNEAAIFLPIDMNTTAGFERFLNDFLPGTALESQRHAIKEHYNCPTEPAELKDKEEAAQMLKKANIPDLVADLYAWNLNTYIRPKFQQYFASFALSGNPNDPPSENHVAWPTAKEDGDQLSNVLSITDWIFKRFNFINDKQNTKSACDLWSKIAQDIISANSAAHNEEGISNKQASPNSDEL